MPGRARLAPWIACVLALVVAGAEWARARGEARPATAPATAAAAVARDPAAAPPELRLRSTARLPAPPGAPSAHAAALASWAPAPGAPARLLAVWWAGSRESGPDVRVYLSQLGPQGWTAPRPIVDRESLGRALGAGVRRIGNAVLHASPDGRLHLFVVATGLGGWAAGRVAHLVATGPDAPFEPQRLLPLTPLANTSVLVRAQAVPRADGGWWLPAYFELGRKYPMAIGFAADGTMTSIERIGRSTTSLQPALLPLPEGGWIAYLRDHGPERRIQVAERESGAPVSAGTRAWHDRPALPLGNVDTAVAALALADGGYLLAHNDTGEPGTTPRSVLRLQVSADGRRWQPGPVAQRGEPGAEFSYPNLLEFGGQVHLVYTHRREGIGHVVFDIAAPRSTP